MEIHSVLRRLRREKGLTQPQVAEYLTKAGLPATHKAVSKWEQGVTKPDGERLLWLLRLYGVRDIQAAFFGRPADGAEGLNALGRARVKEYVELLKGSADFAAVPPVRRPAPRVIPLYDLPVSAGYGLYLDSDGYELTEADETVPADASYAVRISGDSMSPRFEDGRIIYVRRHQTLEDGEYGIFRLNGAAYCKRLSTEPPALISLNPAYPAMAIGGGDELRVLGKVVG